MESFKEMSTQRVFGQISTRQLRGVLERHFGWPWFAVDWLSDVTLSAFGFLDSYELSQHDVLQDIDLEFDEVESIERGIHMLPSEVCANGRVQHVTLGWPILATPFPSRTETLGEDIIRRSNVITADSLQYMIRDDLGSECPIVWFTAPSERGNVVAFLLFCYDRQDCIWVLVEGASGSNRTIENTAYKHE